MLKAKVVAFETTGCVGKRRTDWPWRKFPQRCSGKCPIRNTNVIRRTHSFDLRSH